MHMVMDLLGLVVFEKWFVSKSESGVYISLVLVVLDRVTAVIHIEPVLFTQNAQIFASPLIIISSAHFSQVD